MDKKTISLKGVEGNKVVVLAHAKHYQRELKSQGKSNTELDVLIAHREALPYEQLIERMEKTNLFKFER